MFWNRLINKGFGKSLIAIFSILLCIAVFPPGCGRKAPPVHPGQTSPSAFDDLNSSINKDMLELAWTIPDENRKIASGTRHSHEGGNPVFLATSALLDSRWSLSRGFPLSRE